MTLSSGRIEVVYDVTGFDIFTAFATNMNTHFTFGIMANTTPSIRLVSRVSSLSMPMILKAFSSKEVRWLSIVAQQAGVNAATAANFSLRGVPKSTTCPKLEIVPTHAKERTFSRKWGVTVRVRKKKSSSFGFMRTTVS
jgi:hypothetical protein